MEYKSRPSKLRKFSKKRDTMIDPSILKNIISKYAQAYVPGEQTFDPTQLQVGQSVYDAVTGEESVVVEDPEGTTTKVLMPKSQTGSEVPVIQTMEEAELASQYRIQEGTEGAQMAETAEKKASTKVLPEFINKVSSLEGRFVKVLPEFEKVKTRNRVAQTPQTSVFPDVRSFHDPETHEVGLEDRLENDDSEGCEIIIGQPGFVDIMNEIKDMVDEGYQVVDVVLTIGERFPREQGTKVLEEARTQGVL